MKENVILVDCDGVLCNWEYAFTQFMHHKGFPTLDTTEYNVGTRFGFTREQGHTFVEEFNASAAIAFLPPLRDSVYYMKRLHMLHGFQFHCITSLSKSKFILFEANKAHSITLKRKNFTFFNVVLSDKKKAQIQIAIS